MVQDGICGGAIFLLITRTPNQPKMPAEQRNDLRTRMRRLRRAVDVRGRTTAATKLRDRLTVCEFYQSAGNIGAYFPNDGEIDTWPLMRHAWSCGKIVYLPVLQPGKTLGFAMFAPDTQLEKNRYGIPQPRHNASDLLAATQLDLILLPLVAFDSALFRLGMGGGYYDKTLDFVGKKPGKQPFLAGIGYEFQRVATVLPQTWDVPASCIVTDQTIHYKSQAEK